MTPTDTQRHMAAQAALYALHPRARLIHLRASGRLILTTLAMPDGSLRMVRAATADHAELDALPERERSRVRSAFLALAQRGEASDAA
jgi:hypothetical protein